MAGRTVRLATGLAASSGVGDQLVTQGGDAIILQSGDLLITQSSDGAISVHDVTVTLAESIKSVTLLAGLAATSDVGQPLTTQAGDLFITQAGDTLILQAVLSAAGVSVLDPSVVLTGS